MERIVRGVKQYVRHSPFYNDLKRSTDNTQQNFWLAETWLSISNLCLATALPSNQAIASAARARNVCVSCSSKQLTKALVFHFFFSDQAFDKSAGVSLFLLQPSSWQKLWCFVIFSITKQLTKALVLRCFLYNQVADKSAGASFVVISPLTKPLTRMLVSISTQALDISAGASLACFAAKHLTRVHANSALHCFYYSILQNTCFYYSTCNIASHPNKNEIEATSYVIIILSFFILLLFIFFKLKNKYSKLLVQSKRI